MNSVVFAQLVVVISADEVGSDNRNKGKPQCKLNIDKQRDMDIVKGVENEL